MSEIPTQILNTLDIAKKYNEQIQKLNNSHRQQFIASSRKSCTSEWVKHVESAIKLYEKIVKNTKVVVLNKTE